MKGADFLIGWVDDETGEASIVDAYDATERKILLVGPDFATYFTRTVFSAAHVSRNSAEIGSTPAGTR